MHLTTHRRPVRRPRVPVFIDLTDTLRHVTPEFSKRAGLAAQFPPITFLMGEDAVKFTMGLGNTFDDSTEYTRGLIEEAEANAQAFDNDPAKAAAELFDEDDFNEGLARAAEWAAGQPDEDPMGLYAARYDLDTDDIEPAAEAATDAPGDEDGD